MSRRVWTRGFMMGAPRDFGAVGDGVADDTAALNRCLAASRAVDFGGPELTYLVTGTLLAGLAAQQVLAGHGATVKAGAAGVAMLRLAGGSHRVSGLVFAGDPGAGGTGVVVESAGARVARCSFVDVAGSGVAVRPGAHHTWIAGCAFHHCGHRAADDADRYAVSVTAADHCAVLDNEVVDAAGGVWLAAPAPAWVGCFDCRGNTITGGPGTGIRVGRGRGGRLSHNTVTGLTGDAVVLAGCAETAVTGNTVAGGATGVTAGGGSSGALVISGNVLREPRLGVRVSGDAAQALVAGVTIARNTISRPADGGILVTGSGGAQVTGIAVVDNDIHLEDAGGYGVVMSGAEVSRVGGNRVHRPTAEAIRLDSVDIVQVAGNTLQDAGTDAVAVTGSTRVVVRGTLVYGRARHAVRLDGGSGMTVAGTRWRSIGPTGVKDGATGTTLLDNLDTSRVRVMPLGDSITDGMEPAYPGAYRPALWQRLSAGGYPVDFVGSRANGPAELADPDHEGHVGWRIAQVHDEVVAWLRATLPRVVLLHIGTNDAADPAASVGAPDRLSALLDRIVGVVPRVHLFVAQIIDRPVNAGNQARVRAYNAAIPGIVQAKRDAGYQVHLVDMFSALTVADLADDRTHPNATGYSKMAAVWYDAMRSVPSSLAP